jgi:DNA-binding transcriptional ArsR family regulator
MTRPAQSIFTIQAELCRAMGSALSQEIVHCLGNGPMYVNDIACAINLSPPIVSRHLAILRQAGVVIGQRQGDKVLYHLTNPKIIQVCNLMREVLIEHIRLQMAPFNAKTGEN